MDSDMDSDMETLEEIKPYLPDFNVFRDELAIAYPGLGYALWDPQPGNLPPVEIGDVGFVWNGNFVRLFNALLPGDHPSHARFGVPENYEPLQLREQDHIDHGTLSPRILSSYGLPSGGSGVFESGSIGSSDMPFSYTKPHGAILSLPVTSQREDTLLQDDFSKWFITNFDSCSTFADELGPESLEIILVTGRHRTRTWSKTAFNGNKSPGLASALDAHVDWQTLIPELPWIQGPTGENCPEGHSIFIRGFRIKKIAKPKPENDLEQEFMVEWIGRCPEHKDPLELLSEYIAKRAPGCDMVLIHDNDLEQILSGLDQTFMDTFQPEMLTDYLERLNPGIRVTSDSLPTDVQGPRVAMLSWDSPGSITNREEWRR